MALENNPLTLYYKVQEERTTQSYRTVGHNLLLTDEWVSNSNINEFNRIEQISKCILDNENQVLLWKKKLQIRKEGRLT